MKITHEDGRFTLEAMSGQKITVNRVEISQLVLLSKDYEDRIQQIESRKATPISSIFATGANVRIDSHHTQIFLQLRGDGYQETFEIPNDLARGIVTGLTNQLGLIEEAAT